MKKYFTWWQLLVIPELFIVKVFSNSPYMDEGSAFGACLFTLMIPFTLFWGWFKQKWKSKAGKVILGTMQGLLSVCILYALVLSGLMIKAMCTHPKDPKVLIVLGCQVDGTKPSDMLERRLRTAKETLDKYPEAVCILSGGKGPGELITEAECMKNYLTENGIDESRLILEDKSFSTESNMENSFALTDEREITIITSNYHEFRASWAAKKAGAKKVYALPASTDIRYLPSAWVREWMGISYMLIME